MARLLSLSPEGRWEEFEAARFWHARQRAVNAPPAGALD
jgi:hypothetical protein